MHSTISRTRRLIDVETHEAVFAWILQRLADAGTIIRRRVYLRGHTNIRKRALLHTAALNLGLLMRALFGVSTPRSVQGRVAAFLCGLWALIRLAEAVETFLPRCWSWVPHIGRKLCVLCVLCVLCGHDFFVFFGAGGLRGPGIGIIEGYCAKP